MTFSEPRFATGQAAQAAPADRAATGKKLPWSQMPFPRRVEVIVAARLDGLTVTQMPQRFAELGFSVSGGTVRNFIHDHRRQHSELCVMPQVLRLEDAPALADGLMAGAVPRRINGGLTLWRLQRVAVKLAVIERLVQAGWRARQMAAALKACGLGSVSPNGLHSLASKGGFLFSAMKPKAEKPAKPKKQPSPGAYIDGLTPNQRAALLAARASRTKVDRAEAELAANPNKARTLAVAAQSLRPDGQGVSLMERARGACQWPLWGWGVPGREGLYCGADACRRKTGAFYCDAHEAVSVRGAACGEPAEEEAA